MADLSKDDVVALARAVGIELAEPELTEVTHHVTALLEAMDAIDVPGLGDADPMPLPPAWPHGGEGG